MLLAYVPMAVPFIVGLSVHAASIIFFRQHEVAPSSLGIGEQIRVAVRLMIDIRGIGHADKESGNGMRSRLIFAAWNGLYILILCSLSLVMAFHLPKVLLPHGMEIDDLSPARQGLLPSSLHDLAVRTLMTVNWIWATYFGLNLGHSICSITFVSVLDLDQPSDWPLLFGSILEATSVHRFWGTFWQKLHVRPFEALMPPVKSNLARALLMFLMSAACHALADFASYGENTIATHLWFFMNNFAVCAVEVFLLKAAKKTDTLESKASGIAMSLVPLLGYVWVFTFFVCVTPRWQYPLVWKAISQGMEMDVAAY